MDEISSKVWPQGEPELGQVENAKSLVDPSCGIQPYSSTALHPSFSPLGLVAFFLFLTLIPLLSSSAHLPSLCAITCSSSFTHPFLPSTGSCPARTNATHTTRLVSGLSLAFFLFLALIFVLVLCAPTVSADHNKSEYGTVIGIGM